MHYESACYFLPLKDIREKLELDEGRDVRRGCVRAYSGYWHRVLVELYDYPIGSDRAWLPHQHEYAGKMGTRVLAQAERYTDLLQFKLYLRGKIDKYRVPG